MQKDKVIKIIETERECVRRDCDRDCGRCDLVMDKTDILLAYNEVLKMLRNKAKPSWRQGKAFCGNCGAQLPAKKFETNYCHYCGCEILWGRLTD